MKAEHYIKSGLNGIPTSVMRLADCLQMAAGEWQEALPAFTGSERQPADGARRNAGETSHSQFTIHNSQFTVSHGRGLPSQSDFTIQGPAFVTDTPITFLGFVNRETGVIEEDGHPANGESLAGRIAIFPKGSGSTVAPYVLLELYYRGVAPLAIVNTDIDQQSAPACSLEGIPYAHSFDADIIQGIRHGDRVELRREGEAVTIRVLSPGQSQKIEPDV
jgi:uncharacterized protein